ncbi:MAG: PQQ-binding-like beta-propeller repeat protein, partial [bacterium]
SPVIDASGVVYLQAHGRLVALDYYGALAWSFSTGAAFSACVSSPAIGIDRRIYGATDYLGTLYAIDTNYTFVWSYRTGGLWGSSPAIGYTGNVYIGSYDDNLYAFTSNGALAWSYLTGDNIYSSSAIDTSENIYIGSRDNRFYAFTSVGVLSWSYMTNDADIDSSPGIDARGWVYVGAQDNRIYAFTTYDGTLVWTYVVDGPVDSSPAIGSGGSLYVGSNDNNLYALGTAQITYEIYGDEDPGEVSWIAVPFCGTGIETTEDLGNAIAALLSSPANLDKIYITWLDASTQTTDTTTGTYYSAVPIWVWANSADIIIGTMYKVTVTLANGFESVELTLTGCAEPVEFTIHDLAESGDNENWISIPWSKWYLDTTFDLGPSTVYWWPDVSNLDTWYIDLWNIDDQSTDTTQGTYYDVLGDWLWTNEYDIWPGLPVIIYPTDKNDQARSIYWP